MNFNHFALGGRDLLPFARLPDFAPWNFSNKSGRKLTFNALFPIYLKLPTIYKNEDTGFIILD
jgi:hypothetical protein